VGAISTAVTDMPGSLADSMQTGTTNSSQIEPVFVDSTSDDCQVIEDGYEADCLGIGNSDVQAVEYGSVGCNRQLPSDVDSVSVISDGGNSSGTEVITDTNTLVVDTNNCMVDINASTVETSSAVAATVAVTECDIGKLLLSGINVQNLNREHIFKILSCEPNSNASYPRTQPYGSGSYRQFQPSWLKQHPWLHYSQHVDGVFCRACVFFTPNDGTVGGQAAGQFVSVPFKNWVVRSQKMNAHAKRDYHLTAMTRMKEFLTRYKNPTKAIDVAFETELQQRIEHNQKVLESLFRIILLCGKQGIPLRGHRDDNIPWFEEEESGNLGNFVELVKFRAETDEILHTHLENAPRNALYTSKTIQNEMIDVIGAQIRNSILTEVRKAKYFSVIADEVTDVANREQLSISVRYCLDFSVKEVFLDFVQVERITGKNIADAILQKFSSWELCLSDLRGQCYDGSSNMAGAKSGCKALVQEQAPMALYTHCAAHQLNLSIVAACKIQAFRNAESCIGEIARFFKFSPKRQQLFDKVMESINPSPKAKKLKDACRTRWVERIDSYIVFLELLPSVHVTLQAISSPGQFEDLGTNWNWDGETISKANGFLYQLESSPFLISFKILLEALSSLRALTLKLQMQAIDVLYAYKEVKNTIKSLKEMRENSQREFNKIFTSANKLGQDLHGCSFRLTHPRINRRQVHRDNAQVSSTEEYYRISYYNEFISHIISELQDRFIENPLHGFGLLYLLPTECCSDNAEDSEDDVPGVLLQAVDFYQNDIPHALMFPTEYRMWVRMWKQKQSGDELPRKLIDVYKACDYLNFPNIHILLQLALTLPITSCESERSFSQLKLIKTSRRSTMVADRLSGLAIMKINRHYCDKLCMAELVKSFMERHPRRIKLPFILSD